MLVYVHGFTSSPASHTGGLFRAAFGAVHLLAYSCAAPFAENLALLLRQMTHVPRREGEHTVLVASSLGGFYGAHLAAHCGVPAILLNPCVAPAEQLRPFIGVNQYTNSQLSFVFTPELCASYADAPDPRTVDVPRAVLVGSRDAVLDPAQTLAYWQDAAYILHTDDAHSIVDVSPQLRAIVSAALREGSAVRWTL